MKSWLGCEDDGLDDLFGVEFGAGPGAPPRNPPGHPGAPPMNPPGHPGAPSRNPPGHPGAPPRGGQRPGPPPRGGAHIYGEIGADPNVNAAPHANPQANPHTQDQSGLNSPVSPGVLPDGSWGGAGVYKPGPGEKVDHRTLTLAEARGGHGGVHWFDYFNPRFWLDHRGWVADNLIDPAHRAAYLAAHGEFGATEGTSGGDPHTARSDQKGSTDVSWWQAIGSSFLGEFGAQGGPYADFIQWAQATPGFIAWAKRQDARLPGFTAWLDFMGERPESWTNATAYVAAIRRRWPAAMPYVNAIVAGHAQDAMST